MAVKNPWLADAAKGATQATYEIRTVVDFLQVPPDRRCICLREFDAWLALQESVTNLICAAGDALNTPVPREALRWSNDVFRWVDDGRATVTIVMGVEPPSDDAVAKGRDVL